MSSRHQPYSLLRDGQPEPFPKREGGRGHHRAIFLGRMGAEEVLPVGQHGHQPRP
ncbi:hypothetical protein [Archangium violaceum]|uniref:hypothetical protein n=1 Tax=Archangium violaceum TaxID=83451 RepID=UPI0013634972|nr:hypothetical protein [Archangium violaceum]